MEILWALVNLAVLIGIILGLIYFIFYVIRKVKVIDRRMENIEKKLNQDYEVNDDK